MYYNDKYVSYFPFREKQWQTLERGNCIEWIFSVIMFWHLEMEYTLSYKKKNGIHTDVIVKPGGDGPGIPAHKSILVTYLNLNLIP